MFIGYMDPTSAAYSPHEYPPAPPEPAREEQPVSGEPGAAEQTPPPAEEHRGNYVDETA